jgi:NADH-quinone oxidoreductase subunit N
LPFQESNYILNSVFLVVGLLSIVVGTFNAFLQQRLKRFLAFSGIIHLGYILLGFGTGTYFGLFGSFFYLLVYLFTNLLFWGYLLTSKTFQPSTNLLYLSGLKNILRKNYFIFFLGAVPLLSYGGFPPFAGFFSKFFVLFALSQTTNVVLVISLVSLIVINGYLYLRFLKIALFETSQQVLTLPRCQLASDKKSIRFRQNLNVNFWATQNKQQFLFFFFLLNILFVCFLFLVPNILQFCFVNLYWLLLVG